MMSEGGREPTRILAEFAAALSYDDLPQRSREHCKNLILDALACAPDGKTAVSGDADGKLILWDLTTAQPLRTWTGHPKAITALSRLAAVNRRLQSMLQAVSQVNDALDDFYATLSEEQKAQFEAIGPKRTA